MESEDSGVAAVVSEDAVSAARKNLAAVAAEELNSIIMQEFRSHGWVLQECLVIWVCMNGGAWKLL